MNTPNLNDILAEIQHLDKGSQWVLLERLASMLRRNSMSTAGTTKISDISGVGSDLWRGMDIDDYIESERQW